jgi:hypothetical protein
MFPSAPSKGLIGARSQSQDQRVVVDYLRKRLRAPGDATGRRNKPGFANAQQNLRNPNGWSSRKAKGRALRRPALTWSAVSRGAT